MKAPMLPFDEPLAPPVIQRPPDTREQAFNKAKPNKQTLRLMLVKSFYEGEWNADRWANEHNVYFLNVRPRVSEINKAGMLHRTRFGLSNQGNNQDVFTLFPYIKTRMQLLACKFGIDKAAEQILAEFKVGEK